MQIQSAINIGDAREGLHEAWNRTDIWDGWDGCRL